MNDWDRAGARAGALGASDASRRPIPTGRSACWCRSRPAARSTRWPASSGSKLSESIGQPVIIENRPGAGGNLAADVLVKSPPDGYTVLQTVNGIAISPSLYKVLPFDVNKDFVAVTQLVRSQLDSRRQSQSSRPTTSPS